MFALLVSLTAAADAPASLAVGVHQGAIGPGGTATFSVPLVAGERISIGAIATGAPFTVALAPPGADPTHAKTDPTTRRLSALHDRATTASTYSSQPSMNTYSIIYMIATITVILFIITSIRPRFRHSQLSYCMINVSLLFITYAAAI